MNNSFFSSAELLSMGFKSLGRNVLISRFAHFYGVGEIEIGNNVRIDDFCIISGKIKLGSFIHISAFSALYGSLGIELEDYTGLSPRCSVFSASDDFGGNYLISPMVPEQFTKVTGGRVLIKKFSQIGAGSVILPGVTINEGVAVGAMSLVKKDVESWGIYAGNPLRLIRVRERGMIELEKKMNENIHET